MGVTHEKLVWDGDTSGAIQAYRQVVEADRELLRQIKQTLETADKGSKEWQQAKAKEADILRRVAADTKKLEQETESLRKKQEETGKTGESAFNMIKGAIAGISFAKILEDLDKFREKSIAASKEVRQLAAAAEIAALERSPELTKAITGVMARTGAGRETVGGLAAQLAGEGIKSDKMAGPLGAAVGAGQGLGRADFGKEIIDFLGATGRDLSAENITGIAGQIRALQSAGLGGVSLGGIKGQIEALQSLGVSPEQGIVAGALREERGGSVEQLTKAARTLNKAATNEKKREAFAIVGIDPETVDLAKVDLFTALENLQKGLEGKSDAVRADFLRQLTGGKPDIAAALEALMLDLPLAQQLLGAQGTGVQQIGAAQGLARTTPEAQKNAAEARRQTAEAEQGAKRFDVDRFKQEIAAAAAEAGVGDFGKMSLEKQLFGFEIPVIGAQVPGLAQGLGQMPRGAAEDFLGRAGQPMLGIDTTAKQIIRKALERMQADRAEAAGAGRAAADVSDLIEPATPLQGRRERTPGTDFETIFEQLQRQKEEKEKAKEQARAGKADSPAEVERKRLTIVKQKLELWRDEALDGVTDKGAINKIKAERQPEIDLIERRIKRLEIQIGEEKLGPGGGLLDLPARRRGGPVAAGDAYMVGEAGPEVFVPNQSGNVAPGLDLSDLEKLFKDSLDVQRKTLGVLVDISRRRTLDRNAHR